MASERWLVEAISGETKTRRRKKLKSLPKDN
jgi:hypothetical protein